MAAVCCWNALGSSIRDWRLARAAEELRSRTTVARLTGLDHVPATFAPRPSRDLQLQAATAAVLRRDRSPHARGRALLLRGDTQTAVEELREASKTGDPDALSDLAAALITESDELDAWESSLDAIVAARRAIAISPDLAPAHFNLALALKRIGLTAEARQSFEMASRLESKSEWGAEAARRAAALPRRTPDAWAVTERRLKSAPDAAGRRNVILSDPHLARVHAEGPYLTDWASARIAGRLHEAESSLTWARTIATVLHESSGERLALDAVSAVERAEAGGQSHALARAHLTYLEGRLARRDRDDTRAVALLAEAARALARNDSPLQYVARYYAAGALYEQGRIDEALAALDALDRENLQVRGYRGLSAQLGWERGICLEVRGAFAEALDVFDRSHAAAWALGERDLAARFDGLAAESLEFLGESRQAWRRRSRALRAYAVSGRTDTRKAVTLTSAAQLRIAAREWERARALLDYAIPIALEGADAIVTAQALAKRSVVRDELNDTVGAAHDRATARQWAIRLAAPGRERLEAEIRIAEGVARRIASPKDAIAHFTRAIDLLARRGQTSLLPRVYFELARARQATGDRMNMRSDLHAGLRVVSQWEGAVTSVEQRAALSVWGDAIERSLIALELEDGNLAAAFSHADNRYTAASMRLGGERGSNRGLYAVQEALAPDAAILEIRLAGESMIVFLIRPGDARAYRVKTPPARLAALASSMRENDNDAFLSAATALHESLLAPIQQHLHGVTTLIVVPERELTAVPFSALRNARSERYLLEDMAVVHAPSAAAALTWSRRAQVPSGGPAIAIGSSAFARARYPEVEPLPHAAREAKDVAALWSSGRVLVAEEATVDRALGELPLASTIHYAGHIVGRGADARLLLAPSGSRDSLSAREIAQLRLNARVAVLAGCRAAGVTEPHAVIGDIATAFLAAGSSVVIASATDIDDAEARSTMRLLHSFLAEGADPAQAVRQTVLLDLKKGRRVPLSLRMLVYGGSRSVLSSFRVSPLAPVPAERP